MKTRYVHRLALATVLILGTVSVAAAAGTKNTPRSAHREHKPSVKYGRPNSYAKDYRLDGELTRRSKDLVTGPQTSSVIVRFKEGKTEKDLPKELLPYLQKRT